MGLINGYVLLLPAVTIGGWIVSWRGEWWIRMCLLIVASVVSLLCVAHGFLTMDAVFPSAGTHYVCCRSASDSSPDPTYWIAAGVIDFACSLVLALVTVVVEIARYAGRRA